MYSLHTIPFWRSFVMTGVLTLVALPLLGHAVIDYGERQVAIEAHRNVNALGESQIMIVAQNKTQIPLNAVEFELKFDPATMQVTDSTVISPLCEERFVITDTVDNETGVVFLQCGTITPVTATTTTIATLTIESRNTTTTSVFTKRTNLYAHDGYGTNVTGSTSVLYQ